jgi:hypothetical protein
MVYSEQMERSAVGNRSRRGPEITNQVLGDRRRSIGGGICQVGKNLAQPEFDLPRKEALMRRADRQRDWGLLADTLISASSNVGESHDMCSRQSSFLPSHLERLLHSLLDLLVVLEVTF